MKKIPFIIVLLVIVTSLAAPLTVLAGETPRQIAGTGGRQIAQVTMQESLRPPNATNFALDSRPESRAAVGNIVLQIVAGSLILVAGPFAVLMIAVGGLRYVISHGDQTQMDGAKKTITWAIIGLIVIIVSYAVVNNIINIISSTGAPGTQAGGQPAGGGAQTTPPPTGGGAAPGGTPAGGAAK